MVQNKSMKTTALLLTGVLATSCFVGGTMARYITTTMSEDSARVAVWGINADGVDMDLFASEYDANGNRVAKSWNGDKIIAPGTSMSSLFSIVNLDANLAPEVMNEIKVDVDDTEIDQRILDNASIQWKLDDNAYGTWDECKADILALSGDASGRKVYQALEVAEEFADGKTHTIYWRWMLDDNHAVDTAMGNQAVYEDIVAKINVKVTARQVQDDTVIAMGGAASVNGVAYDTLQEAVNAAAIGDTVTLTEDVTESVTIAEGQNITLNLNGYNITGNYTEGVALSAELGFESTAIKNSGVLTIKGSGIVDGKTDFAPAIFNKSTGSLTLLGGTYTRSLEDGIRNHGNANTHNSQYTIINNGILNVNGEAVIIDNNGNYSSTIANTANSGSNGLYMDGGIGTLIISAGTIKGGRHAITNNNGALTINGGHLLSRDNGKDVIGHDVGTLTINGGEIISTTGIAITAEPNTEITINGGIITGNIDADATVTITDNR